MSERTFVLTYSLGYGAHIGRRVPEITFSRIIPMFEKLASSMKMSGNMQTLPALQECDWAIHPGGIAILQGAQKALGVSDHHMRASYDVYKRRGNSASTTILSVLDHLRSMGEGRDNVVMCSFGPGVMVEMAILRRCRR